MKGKNYSSPCDDPNGIMGGCTTGTDGVRDAGKEDDDTPPGPSKLEGGYPRFISNTGTKKIGNYINENNSY